MESYWKLLDLQSHEYTTHETEEEVNHIIDYLTRDIGSDIQPKEIVATKISTPFSNYEFIHVVVFENSESGRYHAFVYFFDSIEEQCDAFEEEITEKNHTICEQQERLSKSMLDGFYGVTRADILEAGLNECEKTIDVLEAEEQKLVRECKEIEKALAQRDKILEQIRDVLYPF